MKQVRNVLLAGVVGASVLAPIYLAPVYAVDNARASSTQSVGSGKVQIFATATQTFSNPGAGFSTPAKGVNNFYVENGGTILTPAFNMNITQSGALTYLKRCDVGVLFTGTSTCATGSPTTIAISINTLTALTLTFAPSTWYEFEISSKSATQIDTSVLSSQIGTHTYNS